jgi:hypothetical protein
MTYEKYTNRGQVNFEDDMVIVFNGNGEVIYKGIEDYEPMNDEPWKYDPTEKVYRLGEYIKVCIE